MRHKGFAFNGSFVVSVFLFAVVSSMIANCKRTPENNLDVNFSFAICLSSKLMQITPFVDESGRQTANVQCSSSYISLPGLAILMYTNGTISVAPMENEKIDFRKEKRIVHTISLLHKGEDSLAYEKGSDTAQDLVLFSEKTTVADITLIAGITQDNLIYKIFDELISSLLPEGVDGKFSGKNIIFISSYLSTKNLSNVPFILFDEVSEYIKNNYKISDVTINFPESVTPSDTPSSVTLYPGDIFREIAFVIPVLTPVFPDINFRSILATVSERKTSYSFELTKSQVFIPIYLANLNENIGVDLIAFYGDKTLFGKIESIKQPTAFMDVLPPSPSDVETTVNFIFPEEVTEEVTFELYTYKRLTSMLIWKDKISRYKNKIKMRIHSPFISDSYYTKLYVDRKTIRNETEVHERFERYEVSEGPYVHYDVSFVGGDRFVFEAEVREQKISLLWRIPFRLKIDGLNVTPLQNCRVVDPTGVYLTRDCISAYIEIVGSDPRGDYISLWRIYNLDRKNKVVLPNIVENKELIFDAIEAAPEMKLKYISLVYVALFENTIMTYIKTFRYER